MKKETKNEIPQAVKEFFAEHGQKGGNSTKRKFGKEHYSKIAKKRWAKRKKTVGG